MPAGGNAQTLAYQFEKVLPRISLLFHRDHTFFDKIQKRDNLEVVSTRAMRIPLDILAGGKFRQVNPDGGDFGRGSAITADLAQITSVYFAFAVEYTKLAEAATDSKEKAIQPMAKRNLESAIDQMRAGIESLLASDGSGTLDTVVAVNGAVLTVNNANQSYDNQDVDVYASVGGAFICTVTILSVDANAKTLTLTVVPPGGVAAGVCLMVSGAPGAATGWKPALLGARTQPLGQPAFTANQSASAALAVLSARNWLTDGSGLILRPVCKGFTEARLSLSAAPNYWLRIGTAIENLPRCQLPDLPVQPGRAFLRRCGRHAAFHRRSPPDYVRGAGVRQRHGPAGVLETGHK
jgi:SAM-dependent methyltransferase